MRITKFVLAAGLMLAASSMFAATLAVGTCEPSYPSFPTIGAAVAAARVSGSTTIYVCPGTYPEQVVITKNITLKGVTIGNSGGATITAPASGLVTNATSIYSDDSGNACGGSAGCLQAQILVQNATATIEDLTINGTNTNLTSCVDNPIGIFYQNASGTITRNNILNSVQPSGYTGCQGGNGIYVESGATTILPNPSPAADATVTISNNNVAGFQKNGIAAAASGSHATIESNVAVGAGPWDGAGQNSILVYGGAAGSVTSNTVGSDVWAPDTFGDTGDAATGILVGYGSESIAISNNQVSNTQYGIVVAGCAGCGPNNGVGDGAEVTNNTITLTHFYDAIDLCANNTTATGNKITGADESGIHLDDSCYGSTTGTVVSGNTISGTCAGVLEGPGAAGTGVGTNTYYNAVNLILTGTDSCPGSNGSVRKAAKSNGPPRPSRP
jgi:parallel beta-helix repeat protein